MQLFQELIVGKTFVERLIRETAIAGEEEPFSIRRNLWRKIPPNGIDFVSEIARFRPCSVSPKTDVQVVDAFTVGQT